NSPGHLVTIARRDPAGGFFFQAEDGIRHFHVTGVQTCALPISRARSVASWASSLAALGASACAVSPRPLRAITPARLSPPILMRSEERRVGKQRSKRITQEHGTQR